MSSEENNPYSPPQSESRSRLQADRSTPLTVKVRLCVMMFLQYFVQGCFLPVIPLYLEHTLGFTKSRVGLILSALVVGPLITWIFVGQLVDRRFSTQRVLAASHLLAGITMLALYTQAAFVPVIIFAAIYSVLFVPSLMLTNSLTFHHLKSREREFPIIRLWGTIGFILPAWLIEPIILQGLEGEALNAARGVVLIAAGIAGIVMAGYCLILPHTPPAQNKERHFAPAIALGLVVQPRFLVLILVTFLIAIVHKFHFSLCPDYLTSILRSGGIQSAWEQRIMSLGQIAEIAVMACLGLMIARLGFKASMLIGLLAYMTRCLVFALAYNLGDPFWVKMGIVCLGQMLHGLCFGCFMAVAFIYFDRTTNKDIRGSVQNMYGTFVIGAGFFAGGAISGWIADHFKSGVGESAVYDWTSIWLTGAGMAVVGIFAFIALFPRDSQQDLRIAEQPV